MTRYRNICFTINNYDDIDVNSLKLLFSDKGKYLVYGHEVGDSGTPHLQGYIELKGQYVLNTLKKYLPRAHIEARRGTPQEAAEYCKKDGDFIELGEMTQQGERTDIQEMVQAIKEGASPYEVYERFPQNYLKYYKCIKELCGINRSRHVMNELLCEEYMGTEWYQWQADVLGVLSGQPHPRKIYWYYDLQGNTGKSYLTTYLILKYNAFLITGGHKNDIFYAYNNQPIIVFDLPRDFQSEDKKYIFDVMENFKNGRFFSGKYESQMKIFKVPHVIVFANFRPTCGQMLLLSEDRWDITEIFY
jgi:hypothetical protein